MAQAADELVAHADSETLTQLRQSLLRLARITEDGHFARRTVRWDDLDAGVHPILQRFVDARLLVTDERGGQRIVEVAHEALFRSWDTLRRWLDESIEELRLRRDLEASSQAWDAAGRSAEYLWRGGRLARAAELGASPGLSLAAVESAFLDAAQEVERAQRDREELRRRRQLRWARVAVSVVSVLLIGAVYLYYRATQERNLSLSQKLASDSALLRESSVDTDAAGAPGDRVAPARGNGSGLRGVVASRFDVGPCASASARFRPGEAAAHVRSEGEVRRGRRNAGRGH